MCFKAEARSGLIERTGYGYTADFEIRNEFYSNMKCTETYDKNKSIQYGKLDGIINVDSKCFNGEHSMFYVLF